MVALGEGEMRDEAVGVTISSIATAIVDEIRTRGYAVIRDLLEPSVVGSLRELLVDVMQDVPPLAPGRPRRILSGLQSCLSGSQFEALAPIVANPVYLAVARNLLGRGFRLANLQGNVVESGCPEQNLHQDVPVRWFVEHLGKVPHVDFNVNGIWMLSDFTLANGATRIVPGSHLSGCAPPRDGIPGDVVSVEGTAGSLLIFHPAVWHGQGVSSKSVASARVAITCGYCAAWFDPTCEIVSPYWQCPVESDRAALTPAMRTLIAELGR